LGFKTNARTLKILEVAAEAPLYMGGISRLVGLLFSELRKRGHEVEVLSPKFRFREFKLSSIPFHKYDNYDIIHLHGPTPLLSDLMLLANKRVVYTHHAEVSWLSERLSRIYRRIHRLLTGRAQAIIVHSYDYARLFNRANVNVIKPPCLLKPANPVGQKSDAFIVLYVGQFRPFKGIDVLIKAASTLRDVDFCLVGDGYLKPRLMRMAESLRNIKFMGLISDDELLRLYRSAHVVCLPSVNTTEGYGLTLIEGALHGCVPLAPNLIGVRENVFRLKGLLFKPKSSTSLAEKIRMLSNDRASWSHHAEKSQNAAYNYANTYTPESYVDVHEEIFRGCL